MNDPIPDPHSLANAKRNLRAVMRAARMETGAAAVNAAIGLRDSVLEKIIFPTNSVIASYNARESELDPTPLTAALMERGHRIVLPVIVGRGLALIFRAYDKNDTLVAGPMGIEEPSADKEQLVPDVLLVPLLAFDKRGHRLGYGGGYYDRTLAALRQTKTILAVGIAFASQEVAEVPVGPYDTRLDHVMTEKS